jgi:hypothetical protein
MIPMRDPVERPVVLAGAVEVLEEVAEGLEEGMIREVAIARVVVNFGNIELFKGGW